MHPSVKSEIEYTASSIERADETETDFTKLMERREFQDVLQQLNKLKTIQDPYHRNVNREKVLATLQDIVVRDAADQNALINGLTILFEITDRLHEVGIRITPSSDEERFRKSILKACARFEIYFSSDRDGSEIAGIVKLIRLLGGI